MSRNWIIKFACTAALLLSGLSLLLTPVEAAPAQTLPTLIVYPYLGNTTPTSVVIAWATNQGGAEEVRYSLDQSYDQVVTATRFYRNYKLWYSATLTGLTENTTYYYKIFHEGIDITPWETVTFTTALGPTATDFTFAVLGDSQAANASVPSNQQTRDLAYQVERAKPNFILRTGDMVYDGGICAGDDNIWNQYVRNYFAVYRSLLKDTPAFTTIGNHEILTEGCGYKAYLDVFHLPKNAPAPDQKKYYSFDWGNAHFTVLNAQQSFDFGSPQYEWLITDLATSTQTWKFVFFHRPPYSAGKHGEADDIRAVLVPLFEKYGVNAAFSGHNHSYERSCPIQKNTCTPPQTGSVVYFVTGGGGAWTTKVSSNWFTNFSKREDEFIKVSVSACRVQFQAINKNGYLFDSYIMDRCARPTTFTSQGTQDGWVSESTRNFDKGGNFSATSTDLRLGDNALNRQFKSILSFNTASLPDEATIISALLRIKPNGSAVGYDPFFCLGDLLVDIRKGSFGKPVLAASDFQAYASALRVGVFGKQPRYGWYTAILNDTGQSIINKTGTTQFRLYFFIDDDGNSRADFMKFFSGDAALNRPELVIIYSTP